jgi:two-component system osmolarity sensor histidine kinase EnvZ
VSVSVQKISRSIAIHIDDDGPGISPEMYQEVFKPFRRLDDSRNSETGGVGLGLSIARDIARGHGGDITLSRSPQSGLRATIILPL